MKFQPKKIISKIYKNNNNKKYNKYNLNYLILTNKSKKPSKLLLNPKLNNIKPKYMKYKQLQMKNSKLSKIWKKKT